MREEQATEEEDEDEERWERTGSSTHTESPRDIKCNSKTSEELTSILNEISSFASKTILNL
jgi:hypothetical protein